jgi:hypothetical protein
MIRVSEITAPKRWELAAQPDQEVHLPHLGLMITLYYRPSQDGGLEDVSVHHDAIRKVFGLAVEPLLKLEPGAAVRSWPK